MSTISLRRSRTAETEFDFTVECDDFGVEHRAFEGLRCSAKYRVWGTVTEDRSGDHITPNGAPEVQLSSELAAWNMYLGDMELPEPLQELLMEHFSDEFDAAFVKAYGGQCAIDYEAMERAA